jgi:16S rRNA (guanine527-N7)-methyltransferase
MMTDETLSPAKEFVNELAASAAAYEINLDGDETARLASYFELVRLWNARLHLVGPSAPAEFATRHVLESLLAARFLDDGARIVDVGSGAGLPIIPCLIVRPRAQALLVESSAKKAVFLREALRRVERHGQAEVLNERFERAPEPSADFLTCRALERFTELFPQLLRWSAQVRTLLLFGGESLREQIERAGLPYQQHRVPRSERRFLFVVERPR